MKQVISALLFLVSTFSFGQKSEYRPFNMVIVSPDTAIIEDELKKFTDTLESDYVKQYYNSIRQMEAVLALKDYPADMKAHFEEKKKEYEEDLRAARQAEKEVKKFRYFETIPVYSKSILQMYFNEYPPNSTFQVVRPKDLKSKNLQDIAEAYKADYVVSYKDVHTSRLDNGLIEMNLTTVLFQAKGSKILFEKRTVGDTNSYGDMWSCSNPLSCLLITSVRSSTTEIFNTISRLQQK